MTPEIAAVYTQAPGAWPNGTRVQKRCSDESDAHANGALATVCGSIGPAPWGEHGYWVHWDDMPGVPCFVVERRLARV